MSVIFGLGHHCCCDNLRLLGHFQQIPFTLPVLKVLFPLQQTLNLTVQAIQTQNPLPLLSCKSAVIMEG